MKLGHSLLALTVLTALTSLTACSDVGAGEAVRTSADKLSGTSSLVGLAGKCLDVNGGSTEDGAVVQLYTCNGTPAQRWTLSDNQIIGPGGKCLDVTDNMNADGAKLQLWSCSGGANQQWTLQDGQIVGLGGRCVDVTDNSSADRTPAQIWSCSGAANQKWAFTDPLAHFYGGNAHWDYGWTAREIVDHAHQVGMTTVRMDTGGYDPNKYGRVHDFAVDIAAIDPNVKVFAAITGGFDITQDEDTNYATAFDGAKAVAKSLGAAGITDFECGNELATESSVFPQPGVPGDVASQYTGGQSWRAMRGAIRGMIAGVKSVNPSYRTGVNFTVAQIAASDMLWNGSEPDGSTGYPTVRWDITTWHNYQVYGSLFGMGTSGHGNNFNLIEYVAKAYGKPIMITEWNANPETSDQEKTVFTTNWLQQAYDNRALYRIESTMIYQMDGGAPDFGLFAFPQQTQAFASFAASHQVF